MSGIFPGRRLGAVLLAGVLALVAADVILWRWAGTLLADGFASWRQARIAEGFAVENGTPHLAGWPFVARLIVPGLTIRAGAAGAPGQMEFTDPEIDLTLALAAPRDLVIMPAAPGRLRLGAFPPVVISAEALSAQARLSSQEPAPPVLVKGHAVTLHSEGGEESDAGGAITIADLDLMLSPPDAAERVDVHLEARAIDLPAAVTWPFGRRIGRLDFTAQLKPPVPLPINDIAATAAAWRDAGGVLNFAPALLEWGGLTLRGEARLTLDQALAPHVDGSAHLIDPDAAVATLGREGLITRQSATAMTAVLSLLAPPPTDGRKPEIDLPFTVDSGTLSAAGIPLLRLPFFPGAVP